MEYAIETRYEEHPFKWFVPENAMFLIVGTFPPVAARWAFDFFYPNPRNVFWKIMSDLAGLPLNADLSDAVNERKKILTALRTGVTDMGGKISRLAPNSLDENLKLIEYMEIFSILDEYPSIQTILLTSSSGSVSALAWFKQYLSFKKTPFQIPKGQKPLRFEIIYQQRTIKVFIMYSPSPRASNRISYPALVEMYKKILIRGSDQ